MNTKRERGGGRGEECFATWGIMFSLRSITYLTKISVPDKENSPWKCQSRKSKRVPKQYRLLLPLVVYQNLKINPIAVETTHLGYKT